jgi:hypothetical protein
MDIEYWPGAEFKTQLQHRWTIATYHPNQVIHPTDFVIAYPYDRLTVRTPNDLMEFKDLLDEHQIEYNFLFTPSKVAYFIINSEDTMAMIKLIC